jgi:hypothetical protein
VPPIFSPFPAAEGGNKRLCHSPEIQNKCKVA